MGTPGAPSDAELATNLAKGSTDLRYLLTQNRVDDIKAQAILFKAGVDTIAKFSASFRRPERSPQRRFFDRCGYGTGK